MIKGFKSFCLVYVPLLMVAISGCNYKNKSVKETAPETVSNTFAVEVAPEPVVENEVQEETEIIQLDEIKEPVILNGAYWNNESTVRIHNQDVVFTHDGKLYQREDLEDVDKVYDSPETQNYLFTLNEGDIVHISKVLIQPHYSKHTADFWLEVETENGSGWFLLAKDSKDYYIYYGNGGEKGDYWDVLKYETYESSSGTKEIPFTIPSRNVYASGYSLKTVEIRQEPDDSLPVQEVLYASTEDDINFLRIDYVTAESDDYFYGGQWFYVSGNTEDGYAGGWTKEISEWYSKNDSSDYEYSEHLFITPAMEIESYFQASF